MTVNRNWRKVVWLAMAGLFLVGSGVGCVRKPVKLRWKLAEGKTYVYRNETNGKSYAIAQTVDEEGNPKDTTLDFGPFGNLIVTEMTVLAIQADTAFHIQTKIQLVREDEDILPTVVLYNMAPNGAMYGISTLESGGEPRFFESKQRREQFYEQSQPVYPDRELEPGQTWVQETKVVFGQDVITAQNQFDVIGWEKTGDYMCLRIDYTGNVVIPYVDDRGRDLIERTSASGSIWFAPEEGFLVQQRDSFKFTTSRQVPQGETPPALIVVESERTYVLTEIR